MLPALKQSIQGFTSDKKFSEILIGSAWALSARVLATVFAIVTNIVIARFYGAQAMGIVAVMNSFIMMVTIFTVLGTGTSILKLIPEHIAKYSYRSAFLVYRKTQYFVAGLSLVTGAIFFWGSELIAGTVFSKPHLAYVFSLTAVFVVAKSLMLLNTQAVRGIKLIKTFAVMQALPSAAMLAMLLASTLFARRPDNPVYAQLFSWLATALAGVVIMDLAFKRKIRPADPIEPMPVGSIVGISMPMFMTATMQFAIGQMGVIMLAAFRSEAEVGYYSAAVKLATLTAFVLQAINSMTAPKFSDLFCRGEIDDLFHVARKSARLIFWTTSPILLFLVVLGKPVLSILFGSEFSLAYLALIFVALGQFVNSISGSTGIFMNMTGDQKALSKVTMGAALLNILLGFALIPPFGINGAAFASMASLSLWNIVILLFIHRKFGKTIAYFPRLI